MHPTEALRLLRPDRVDGRLGLLLTLLVLFCDIGFAQPVDPTEPGLRGRVVDAENGEGVVRANVRLNGAERWTMTDDDGSFAFHDLSPGRFSVRITHIGFEPYDIETIELGRGRVTELEISLTPRPIRLSEVTVTPGRFSFMSSGAPTRQTMTRDEIQSVPQIGEDVFRAVNRLPGLSSGDYSAHFGIRGGRHDETLILLDGLEIYEPYHLKDFDEGAISIIDSETIEGVDLMTGGFHAKYGNRRSGVFRIQSRRPQGEDTRLHAGISFINARVTAMGKLPNGRGSWLASGRSGYLDLIFSFVKQADLPSPRYHDAFGKLELNLSRRHTLLIDVLHAGDKYEFNAASTTGYLDTLRTREGALNKYGNSYAWTVLTSRFTHRVFARTLASAGWVTRDRDGFESYLDRSDPLYSVRENRDLGVFGIKQDWTFEAHDRWVFETGFDLRRFEGKQTLSTVVGQDPNDPTGDSDGSYPFVVEDRFDRNGTIFSSYASQRWRLLDPLVIDLGVRYDRADYTGDEDWSPRVGAAIELGESRTLRAGWGHYRQIQGIDDVSALDADRRYGSSELTEQWTLGMEQGFPDGSLLRVEGYHKTGSELRPKYRNWKGGIDTFPESNEDRVRVYPSSSEARGIEVYYDRQLGERLKMRGSYALSHAEETLRRIENVNSPNSLSFDPKHDAPQDQRHAFNLDLSYPLGRSWLLNGSAVLHSGWPTTLESLVEVVDADGEPDLAILPQKIYGARLPTYYRLDTRVTRRWPGWGGEFRFFGELVNLTNHANVFGYDYYRTPDGTSSVRLVREDETWFTILPSVGLAWTGRF